MPEFSKKFVALQFHHFCLTRSMDEYLLEFGKEIFIAIASKVLATGKRIGSDS